LPRKERRAESFQDVMKITRETGLRITLLQQREDRHGQFRQVLQGQVIQFAARGQLDRGVEVVAPEPAAVADADAFHRTCPSSLVLCPLYRIPAAGPAVSDEDAAGDDQGPMTKDQ